MHIYVQNVNLGGSKTVNVVRDQFFLDILDVCGIFNVDWIAVASNSIGPIGVIGRDTIDKVIFLEVIHLINSLKQIKSNNLVQKLIFFPTHIELSMDIRGDVDVVVKGVVAEDVALQVDLGGGVPAGVVVHVDDAAGGQLVGGTEQDVLVLPVQHPLGHLGEVAGKAAPDDKVKELLIGLGGDLQLKLAVPCPFDGLKIHPNM